MSDYVPMTREGYNRLKSEIEQLEQVEMPKIADKIAEARAEELTRALEALGRSGLRVVAEPGGREQVASRAVGLELVGADHPGIVRDLSNALARRGVNVEELETR